MIEHTHKQKSLFCVWLRAREGGEERDVSSIREVFKTQ